MYKQEYPEVIKKIMRNLHKNTCNNYRKMHRLPMRRWQQEYKMMKDDKENGM